MQTVEFSKHLVHYVLSESNRKNKPTAVLFRLSYTCRADRGKRGKEFKVQGILASREMR